jgi:hypothetical protein
MAFEPGDASGKVANFPRVTARALMAKWFGPKTSVEPGNYTEKSNQVLAKMSFCALHGERVTRIPRCPSGY